MTVKWSKYFVLAALVCILYTQNAAGRDFKAKTLELVDRSHISFIAEWGYTGTVLHKYHNDYVDSKDGYRIDTRDTEYLLYSNAFMQAGVQIEPADHFALALNFGFAGVNQDRRMFPLTLRFSYYFKSFYEDGLFAMAEAGKAFPFDGKNLKNNIARLGGGYRFTLSSRNNIDFKSFIQLVSDHPDIFNMNIGQIVKPEFVNCSDSYYGALVFSIALSF